MTACILVVDDEPDLESLLVQKFRRQIREGTIAFVFAADGVDALEALSHNDGVDMVVTDLNMPRMDGLTLLQKLQNGDHERLSTIVVSAYGDMANIRTAMNRGAFDFLIKPIDFSDLEATIAKTIHHVEVLRESRQRQAEAERINATLARYFSPNLAQRIADSADIDLGGQRREIASLFTDVASFTTLVETLEPDVLGPLLNDYFVGMTEVVFSHDGTVAKIIGDALHVLFGAPGEQIDHASRAIACALDLDDYAEQFRERWRGRGIEIGVTRIGVHAGPAIVGNFGGDRFFDYTAYGDTINTAARLEKANKQLGTRICVSAPLAEKAGGFKGRPVGDLVLRGKTEALRGFEPLRPQQFDWPATASYLGAFARLESGDPNAMAAFAAHVGKYPGDQIASFHLKRLLNGQTGTRIVLE
jgi:adenylate cyclase